MTFVFEPSTIRCCHPPRRLQDALEATPFPTNEAHDWLGRLHSAAAAGRKIAYTARQMSAMPAGTGNLHCVALTTLKPAAGPSAIAHLAPGWRITVKDVTPAPAYMDIRDRIVAPLEDQQQAVRAIKRSPEPWVVALVVFAVLLALMIPGLWIEWSNRF